MTLTSLLGKLGVWLCDHCQPRPLTRLERATTIDYAHLMIDSLKGDIRWYGRDREIDCVIINETSVKVEA